MYVSAVFVLILDDILGYPYFKEITNLIIVCVITVKDAGTTSGIVALK